MEKPNDLGRALELAWHITHPCRDSETGLDIRYIYINLARNTVKEMTNPGAREFLEGCIRAYSE